MKARYWLALSVPIALVACQQSEAPAPQTESISQPQAPVAESQSNAVEVKKPAAGETARVLREISRQAEQQQAGITAAKPAEDMTSASHEVGGKAAAPSVEDAKASDGHAPMPGKQQAAASGSAESSASAPILAQGDAAQGAKIARKCQACHNFNERRKLGPGLAGIFGRKAGTMPDMNYSAALKAGGWRWDAEHLAAWVCDSSKAIKEFSGDPSATTKMSAQRICDPSRQADLIAFLKTL